eukprot:4693944-Prymnesium_polylepis.1
MAARHQAETVAEQGLRTVMEWHCVETEKVELETAIKNVKKKADKIHNLHREFSVAANDWNDPVFEAYEEYIPDEFRHDYFDPEDLEPGFDDVVFDDEFARELPGYQEYLRERMNAHWDEIKAMASKGYFTVRVPSRPIKALRVVLGCSPPDEIAKLETWLEERIEEHQSAFALLRTLTDEPSFHNGCALVSQRDGHTFLTGRRVVLSLSGTTLHVRERRFVFEQS